ncbi:L,D-transpeptidase [Actinacidiphila glaucinigra]|uniref:L,D-transpeptidase family protein n=1 Tax=Actinacidiphila glaucinigra TaxID=235986 RepID=UPI003693DFD0
MRAALTRLAVPAVVAGTAAAVPLPPPALPDRMADTGGGTQLITAVAASPEATTGTLTWWDRRNGRWVAAGSAAARFGGGGLVEGRDRVQSTSTTPAGLYDLPFAFGTEPPPPGTRTRYLPVTQDAWWCQDNASDAYNRWVEPLPEDCAPEESERLADFGKQYAHALVIGFNYRHPVRGRGAGIFLHVNGRGATAGCVSVPAGAMRRVLAWADPGSHPHIAIGTESGATAITRHRDRPPPGSPADARRDGDDRPTAVPVQPRPIP